MSDNSKILAILQEEGYEIVILDVENERGIEVTHTFMEYAIDNVAELINRFSMLTPAFLDRANTTRFIEAKAELIRSLRRMNKIKQAEIRHETGNQNAEEYIPD